MMSEKSICLKLQEKLVEYFELLGDYETANKINDLAINQMDEYIDDLKEAQGYDERECAYGEKLEAEVQEKLEEDLWN